MAEYIEREKVYDIIADIYKDGNDVAEETCIKIWERIREMHALNLPLKRGNLIRRFVGCVGYDYRRDYSPHLWPDFSEDTVELWHEIESRLQAPTCLNFDRDAFQSTIREELEKQEKLLRGGPDYDTSYHYGIKSGINLAWRIVEDNIRKAGEKSIEKNAGKRKKSFEKVEG